jgi:hypothetical protein
MVGSLLEPGHGAFQEGGGTANTPRPHYQQGFEQVASSKVDNGTGAQTTRLEHPSRPTDLTGRLGEVPLPPANHRKPDACVGISSAALVAFTPSEKSRRRLVELFEDERLDERIGWVGLGSSGRSRPSGAQLELPERSPGCDQLV